MSDSQADPAASPICATWRCRRQSRSGRPRPGWWIVAAAALAAAGDRCRWRGGTVPRECLSPRGARAQLDSRRSARGISDRPEAHRACRIAARAGGGADGQRLARFPRPHRASTSRCHRRWPAVTSKTLARSGRATTPMRLVADRARWSAPPLARGHWVGGHRDAELRLSLARRAGAAAAAGAVAAAGPCREPARRAGAVLRRAGRRSPASSRAPASSSAAAASGAASRLTRLPGCWRLPP